MTDRSILLGGVVLALALRASDANADDGGARASMGAPTAAVATATAPGATGASAATGIVPGTGATAPGATGAPGPSGRQVVVPLPLRGPGAAAANPHGDGDGAEDGAEDPATDPHGGHGAPPRGDMFQPPEDGAMDDPTIPMGTLEIHVVDPSGKPLPNTNVAVGVLYNSVAKGESRKRLSVETNATGTARLEHLEGGSTVAYRPMVMAEGATFSMMPFRMPEKMGMRAVLHVYPVVESIEAALIVGQSVLYIEVKDDRIQVQQAFKIYNFGKNAWVPKDLVVELPETFTAFTTQQGMSDVGVDAVPKKGVRLRGTFGPGQHMIEFRWQLPYAGEAEVRFDVGMSPHTAASRVIAPASKDMRLEVPGFPPPQSNNDGQGQRALITEKQLKKEDPPLTKVSIIIGGLPTEGPAKIVATLLSAGGLAMGLVLGTKKPSRRDRKHERARLLAEIEDLERAHLAGDVGPKTYASARRELVDALARTFSDDAPQKATKRRS